MHLWDRLKSEREQMGLTQDEMAMRCGTSKRSYCAYESGETQPKSEFLAKLADAGGDVLYVLTGKHAVGIVEANEAEMLAAYRAAPEAVRKAALAALLTGQTSGDSFIVHGNVGARIDGPVTIGELNVGGKRKR
ncbi:helix-turn-helix domain-containing protein [Uliginosibacterium paludis]|uniref:Helix-turn-helix transcriptional regulator n=1 Tax=Uliginosibacterium paludis TaxID=1615952 RepID=A0ABV2CUJ4_9RHOO